MSNIDWNAKYEIGIAEVDQQHHYFMDLINRLSEELNEEGSIGRKYIIHELNSYVRFHFASEENMMRKARYPDLDTHIAHHHQLLDRLSGKEAQLEIINSKESAAEIIDFLTNWFLTHTNKEDRLFADYLHAD